MIMILGGTAEARALAVALVDQGRAVLSSLAGRVSRPSLPAGEVRIGGFGGVDGLAGYLTEHHVAALVDATHPFAAAISAHAAAAAALTGCRLVRLERPSWRADPRAGSWEWVNSTDEVLAVAGAAQRPFVTTGRQSLASFLPWSDRDVVARVVDPPGFLLPARWRLITSRGPYRYDGERRLMLDAGTDCLVTKDSGGSLTSAKLDAASDLGVPIVVVSRPPAPAGVTSVGTVAQVLAWIAHETIGGRSR